LPFEGWAAARGARLSYTTTGEGPDVVLLHAGIADRRMWEPLTARLDGVARVTSFDQRGFGRTEYEAGPYAPAEDVLALLDELGAEGAVLVGASFGGQVALEAAVHAPARVRALVLLDAALPDHPWSEEVEAFGAAEDAAIEAGDIAEATEVNVRMWAGGAAPAVQDLVRAMQLHAFELQLAAEPEPIDPDPPLAARLGALTMPAAVAHGDRDVADFAAIARRLAGELPSATLHEIAGAGHLPALEQPGAVAALVREVVERAG
jgi:pimeloyl-ACP methyl ester carboxylesterase